jgi:hypothetical protein
MTTPTVEDVVDVIGTKPAWDYDTYDKALAAFVSSTLHMDQKPVPLVFASPERSYAQMRRRFNLEKDQPVPLPFVSLSQVGDTVQDPERFLAPSIRLRNMGRDEDKAITYTSGWPLPYNFQYAIELWVRNRNEARIMLAQLALRFTTGKYIFLTVDHGEPFGEKIVRIEQDSISDNTSLETGEADRSLRWTVTITLFGWLLKPVEIIERAERIEVGIVQVRV